MKLDSLFWYSSMMKNAASVICVGGRDIRRQRKNFAGATKRALPIVYTGETRRKNRKSRSADAPGEESEGFPLTEPMRAWTAETLIDAYGDELLRLCLLYLGDRQLAEDAFQETMVKAWRALPGFRGESGAKTWLFHIAVNTCRDMLRSGWMRMRRRSVPLEVMPELAGQEDERLREMTAAVLALPDKYRETVVLLYYKQMKSC